MLEVSGLSHRFGGFTALQDVTFDVPEGVVHGVIGPNGAGKTTLFDVITGFWRPRAGTVAFGGHDVTKAPVHRRIRAGMARTFQTPRVFDEMTVAENLEVAANTRLHSVVGPIIRRRAHRTQLAGEIAETLAFLGIEEHAAVAAGDLAYAHRRLTEIGRALMLLPRMLLLDEPTAGMNGSETRDFAGLVRALRDRGLTVLIIEHDMDFMLNLCEHCMVLNLGRPLAYGTPEEIRANPKVVEAYLGTGNGASA